MSDPLLILGAIICPMVGALLLALVPEENNRVRNPLAVLTAVITASFVVTLFVRVLNGAVPAVHVITLMRGLDIVFRVDPLAAAFSTLASVLWVFAALYSTGYMAHEHNRRRYFTFYILSLGATMGIAFSANLFTLYLCYEFLTIFTYPLVIHAGNAEAQAAGKRYIIYSFLGAGLILSAIVMTAGAVGTITFASGGILTVADGPAHYLQLIFLCFILGFGVKAAIMPLHAWLPAAMAAPTPVSALLHAVAVVKSGIFGILRAMYSVFGVETLGELSLGLFVVVIASITIVSASLIALRQDALKRRLAYSTISQLSYIILGAGLLSVAGATGGMLHMINHALLKITLFFCAGAIITVTGKKKISELNGVGVRMPLTMMAFTVGSIGMVGILPVNGFISKLYLLQGSLDAGMLAVIAVLVVSAILNALYFFPIVITAFFRQGAFERAKGPEAPLTMLVPVCVLAVICIVLGIKPDLTIPFVRSMVDFLMPLAM
ncbi:monovalent cation/H+ antiporter subunit D family protein [Dethiobacter alkaliphilus]|uniref:NADH dehydrogenase (Quinone) n=1 Tax=Dethiobacter alkaliphilus AHT 1 TaxID=555088 RepID=C0GJ36_DETAL|nr:monovalent cation/H+ antiporter subunit D family protein [Dethiobacter alkaliphilus]EEG76669.1 NADH dehydrogenase (quinone) [Dethiobacter alkaliphilus AHT 1]